VLDVLFRGLKVSPVAWTSFMEARDKKIAIFLSKEKTRKFQLCDFFFNFWSSKPWIRIRIRNSLELLDPDRIHNMA
jgi:hypothetical protein